MGTILLDLLDLPLLQQACADLRELTGFDAAVADPDGNVLASTSAPCGVLEPSAPIVAGGMGLGTLRLCGATVQNPARLPALQAALRTGARMLGELAHARRELCETTARRRALFEVYPDGVLVVDPATARFVDFNTAAHQQLGYSREEFAKLSIHDVEAKETPEDTRASIADVLSRGRADFETVQRHRDGSLRDVHVTAQIVDIDGRPAYHCVWRDITHRKRADQALQRFRAILDVANTGAAIADLDGLIVYANEYYAAAHGYTPTEMMGMPLRRLHDETQLPHVERLLRQLTERGEFSAEEVGHTHRDGSQFPMLMSCKLVRGEAGEPACFVATAIDLTERKSLEEQLLHAQKMESVGRLAGGVAHDFNNMLCVILGNVELALMSLPPVSALQEPLVEVRGAAERSAALTRQLLAFARRQAVAPQVLDLNETTSGMLKMLKRLIGENIELAWEPAGGLWPVRVDPAQIDQLLANLCVNSRDAIRGVGHVRITTRNVVVGPRTISSPDARCGDYVQIGIADDGCGMTQEVLSRVFEPFFTTKPAGQGTGLGLSTVYGIVRQNEGFVDVQSSPGHGTTFFVHLPRYAGPADEEVTDDSRNAALRGHEVVLLVEDEPALLRMSCKALESLGYRVLAAASPAEALLLAEAHGGSIDVLMTDVVMPDMDGRELADRVRAISPGLRCLFMSGYTPDVVADHGAATGAGRFLQKPFSLQEVGARLREVLSGDA